jgi:hypothetical protein
VFDGKRRAPSTLLRDAGGSAVCLGVLLMLGGCIGGRLTSTIDAGVAGWWTCDQVGGAPFNQAYPSTYVRDGTQENSTIPPYHHFVLRSDGSMDVFFSDGWTRFYRPGRYDAVGYILYWESLDQMTSGVFVKRSDRLDYVSRFDDYTRPFIERCSFSRMKSVPESYRELADSVYMSFHVPTDVYGVPREVRLKEGSEVVQVLEDDPGGRFPEHARWVRVRFRGRITDPQGRLGLDLESYPAVLEDTLRFQFPYSGSPGLTRELKTMRERGYRRVTMGQDSAGDLLRNYPDFPKGAVFEFELWLLDVE